MNIMLPQAWTCCFSLYLVIVWQDNHARHSCKALNLEAAEAPQAWTIPKTIVIWMLLVEAIM